MHDRYRDEFVRFATGFALRKRGWGSRDHRFLFAIHNVEESFNLLWSKDAQTMRSGRYLFLRAIGMFPPESTKDYYTCLVTSFALYFFPRGKNYSLYSTLFSSLARYFGDLPEANKITIRDVLSVVGIDLDLLYNINGTTRHERYMPKSPVFLYNVFGEEGILYVRRVRQNVDLLKANGIIGEDY